MQSDNSNTVQKVHSYLATLVTQKKVAILGFAREGQSTYRTLRTFFPTLPLLILDMHEPDAQGTALLSNDPYIETNFSNTYLSHLSECDVLFKTPGIPSLLVEIQDAVTRGCYLTSQTDIFFTIFSQQIIAVTGTKGKSTASKVLHHVLERSGLETVFIGNIGRPAFDAVPEISEKTHIVYETSSHQCEGLHVGPHAGVFLNLFQDHLDYYTSLEAYGDAKRQMFLRQRPEDMCIYHMADEHVRALVANTPPQKFGFSLEKIPGACAYMVGDQVTTNICGMEEQIIAAGDIPLLGEHNILNILPAVIYARRIGIGAETIGNAIRTVTPVEKRLETVAVVHGVTFIDDALATIPEATIAALTALPKSVTTLIVGGFDRGQDFTKLAKVIATSSIRTIVAFPSTGEKIATQVFQYSNSIAVHPVKSMKDAVKIAKSVTKSGETVLLSTASPSFGLFTDYRDRSAQFVAAIFEGER